MLKGLSFFLLLGVFSFLLYSCDPLQMCSEGQVYSSELNECVEDTCIGYSCGADQKCVVTTKGPKCECNSSQLVYSNGRCRYPEFFSDVTCSGHGHIADVSGGIKCVCDTGYKNLSSDNKLTCIKNSFSGECPSGQCTNGKVVTYFENRPNNGVNVFMLGDGYTESDLGINGKYFNDARKKVDFLFTKEPYHKFTKYFNVYIIFSKSREAGIDIDCHVNNVDSVFNTCLSDYIEYNSSGIKIKNGTTVAIVNSSGMNKVRDYVRRAGKGDLHLAIIVANTHRYYYGTAFIGKGIGVFPADVNGFSDDAVNLVEYHESGHAFGLLGDEYETGAPSTMNINDADKYPNLSLTNDPNIIKWKELIPDYGKSSPTDYGIGTYIGGVYKAGVEGGYYRPDRVWRSQEKCVMKKLDTDKFCPVCMNTMLKRIFSIIHKTYSIEDLKHYFPKTYWSTGGGHTLHDLEVFRQARELMSNKGLHVIHVHELHHKIDDIKVKENPIIKTK